MNSFDTTIVHFLIKTSQKSPSINSLMKMMVDNSLLKGGIVVSVLWFFWFGKSERITQNRERIIISIISCMFAIFVGRFLTRMLPFRFRPMVDPAFSSFFPDKSVVDGLDYSSSFPSDTAVMFFALATGIFLISKRIGIFSYLYTLVVICFPRVYTGLHYPTDILAGAMVGTLTTFSLSSKKMWYPITKKLFKFYSEYTGAFFVIFFLISFEISTMFDSLRVIVHYFFGELYEGLLGQHFIKTSQIIHHSIDHFHQFF